MQLRRHRSGVEWVLQGGMCGHQARGRTQLAVEFEQFGVPARFAAWRRIPMTMKGARDKVSNAFTLLEIMVAIALLSLVVVAIYASWNSILKGSRVALDAAAASQRTRITMRTLQDSLLCAC